MRCLNCGTELINNRVSTPQGLIVYDLCEKCGSLWLDAKELDRVAYQVAGSIEYSTREAVDEPADQVLKCPRCDNADLYRVRFLDETDIYLHRCRNCSGFWLNGGQLALLDKTLTEIGPVQGHGLADFITGVHLPGWAHRTQAPSSAVEAPIEAPPLRGARYQTDTDEICPACGGKLNGYSLGWLRFEGCPACKGMWLRPDELRRLKNKADDGELKWMNADLDQLERANAVETKRVCPKCPAQKLSAVIFGGSKVIVDFCPSCRGLWLDRSVFERITEYLDTERRGSHPGDVAQQMRKDWSSLWHGDAEPRTAELENLASDLHALVHLTIFEHPKLVELCMRVSRNLASAGFH